MADRWESVETVSNFIFGGSKIIKDGDYNHKIRRRLPLGRTAMTNLDRDITLPTKVHRVKAMVLPVVMYGGKCKKKRKSLKRHACTEENHSG